MNKNELIEQVAGEFAELKRITMRGVSTHLASNIPPAQGQLLFLVAKRTSLTVKEIAAELSVSSGAISQLVEGLVQAGLLKRVQDQNDRRIVHVLMSQKGMEQVEQVRRDYLASFESTMGSLDEAELQTLLAILQKINNQKSKEK